MSDYGLQVIDFEGRKYRVAFSREQSNNAIVEWIGNLNEDTVSLLSAHQWAECGDFSPALFEALLDSDSPELVFQVARSALDSEKAVYNFMAERLCAEDCFAEDSEEVKFLDFNHYERMVIVSMIHSGDLETGWEDDTLPVEEIKKRLEYPTGFLAYLV